jgi:hypothetical protein
MSSYDTLSEIQGLGRIVFCRSCEDVYVGIGHASYRMPLAAFRELVRMINEAAEHPVVNPTGPPFRFSILEGGLRIGQNFWN